MEGTAKTEYASLSGKIRTMVIDKTLSISGACADAAAVGEALEKVGAKEIENHVKNMANPHNVTAEQIGAATPKELAEKLADNGKGFKRIGYLHLEEDVASPVYIELEKPLSNYHTIIMGVHNYRADSGGNYIRVYFADESDDSYTKHILHDSTVPNANTEFPGDTFSIISLAGGLDGNYLKSLQYAAFCTVMSSQKANVYYGTIEDTQHLVLYGYVNYRDFIFLPGTTVEIWGAER